METTAHHATHRPTRLEQFEVEVVERIVETPDTVTLVFEADRALPPYKAGQFLSIDPHHVKGLEGFVRYFEDVKGRREVVRAYSMASAPHEKLAITIKEEPYVSGQTPYPPLLSPFLVHQLMPGMRLKVTGFTGHYVLEDDIVREASQVVHLCAGSGIVPSYSIVKDALVRGLDVKQTLIYGNKTCSDVIYRDHLAALGERHKDRFTYVQALTRECEGFEYGERIRKGRVSRELIEEFVPDYRTAHFFVCGPGVSVFEKRAAKLKGEEPTPRFIETVVGYLKAMGIPRQRITQEAYG